MKKRKNIFLKLQPQKILWLSTAVFVMLVAWLIGNVVLAENTKASKGKNMNDTENTIKTAIFAAGCFWCIEPPYDDELGVLATTAGYSGGLKETATYKQVSSGNTKHREVIEVKYDSSIVSYARLLDIFWENIDPFDEKGQFCDKGFQYMAAIYYANEEEKKLAEESKVKVSSLVAEKEQEKEIITSIEKAMPFYPAEDYHQDYYKINPYRYKFYRFSCGRDARLNKVWPGRKQK